MLPKCHQTWAKEASISSALEVLPTPNSMLVMVEVHDLYREVIFFFRVQNKMLSFRSQRL